MDAALGWIGQLVSWFAQFFPRWHLIHPANAVVKVTGWSFRYRKFPGVRTTTKRSGIVVWWPAVSNIYEWPVVRQVNNLQAQTIRTTDGKIYVVAGIIDFEIEDIEKLVCEVYDADDSIRDLALGAIHDACCQYSEDGLTEASRNGKLDTAMRQEARTNLRPFGVRVVNVRLTDLSPCRVLRLVSSSPTEIGKV